MPNDPRPTDQQVQELVHRWQMAGGPPDGAATATQRPWRTAVRRHWWRLAIRLALGVFYVVMGVRFLGDGAAAWLLLAFAAYEAGLVGVVIRHERRLVDAYPQAVVVFEQSVRTAGLWQVDEDSPYHPVNVRLAGIRRRGGPTTLQRRSAESPLGVAVGVTLAWSLPLVVALVVAIATTGEWALLALVLVVVPTAILGIRSLRTRAATTATALAHFRQDQDGDQPAPTGDT